MLYIRSLKGCAMWKLKKSIKVIAVALVYVLGTKTCGVWGFRRIR